MARVCPGVETKVTLPSPNTSVSASSSLRFLAYPKLACESLKLIDIVVRAIGSAWLESDRGELVSYRLIQMVDDQFGQR